MKQSVALIAGPTASGKSDLAVSLAMSLQDQGRRAVVINADSAQVYSDLRILSARPSTEDMRGIEHRLFGTWDGATACSAADWAAAAKREISLLHAENAVSILVGGTGLYMRTLLDGIAPVPEIDPEVRAVVRSMTAGELYAALKVEDAERASVLDAADVQRLSRALEVVRSTGRPLSYWQQQLEGGIADDIDLHPLVLLPDRDWLYERCDRRFSLMMEQGALSEVEALLARSLDPSLPVMRAIGVPEIASHLKGELALDEAIAAGQQATRNYAKRQYTWFRRQPPENWPRCESENYDWSTHFARLLRY